MYEIFQFLCHVINFIVVVPGPLILRYGTSGTHTHTETGLSNKVRIYVVENILKYTEICNLSLANSQAL